MKHASAHLLVIYVKIPPKFLTCMKLNGPNILMGLSVAAAALAAVGTTFSVAELADIAPVNIAQVPFPVASAIILPPCLKPNIESIRSGTVMKAKDPARAIMRGTAMTISLDKGPIREVVLDIAIIVNLDRSSRVMCLNDWDQASSRTATAISRSSRCMRVLVDYSSANIMPKIVSSTSSCQTNRKRTEADK